MKQKIVSRWDASRVLYECKAEALGAAVGAAVADGVNLRGADLYGVNLRGADLCDANLCDANLCDANLYDADLSGANLYGADLSGANLSGADLSGANLSGANLSGANLYGANLCGADLRDANLSGVNLRDANLSGVNLSGANLSGADLSGILTASVQWSAHGECGRTLLCVHLPAMAATETQPAREAVTTYWCGCFRGDEAALRLYIADGDERYRTSRALAVDFCAARMAEMLAAREVR